MAKQNKIKVLFTIPNFDTAGSGKALLKVAARLDASRFEPHIACMNNRGAFYKEVQKSGIPVHIIPYAIRMKPYLKGLQHCYKISKVFKEIKPDIIHSFHYAPDYSEPLAARIAGIPWIYTKKNMNWGGSSANGWKLRSLLAKKIIIQNTDMRAEFFKGIKKTVLIPRGVDTNEFKPAPVKKELLQQWNLRDSDRILICVANLVPVKGIHVLIDAFARVHPVFPEWKMMVVGDDSSEYAAGLKEEIQQKGLSDRIIFTGKQSDVAGYLNLASVFALPTLNEGRKEGSPVAMLEAMASACFVLGAGVPGIKDQLAAFPELLVDAGSTAGWENTLKTVFQQTYETRKQKGELLRAYVLKHFTLDHEVKNCEELYEKIAG